MKGRVVKYYQVTGLQLFLMALLTGAVGGALGTINTLTREYFLLPQVVIGAAGCANVVSFKNGEAYTCNDVGTVLRKYRTTEIRAE